MTYDQFISKYIGTKIDYDKAYDVQCVDLAKAFFDYVLGIKVKSIGNAIEYWNKRTTAYISKNFKHIEYKTNMHVQKGDIIIFDSHSGCGHIAICTGRYTKNKVEYYDQNGTGHNDAMTLRYVAWNTNTRHCKGILRPINQHNIDCIRHTKANLNAYTSYGSKQKTAAIIPKDSTVILIDASVGYMSKGNKTHEMSKIKYKSKAYYVAREYLKY